MSESAKPSEYEKIKEIFYAALALEREERSAYLDEKCADQNARREVESLLAAREEAGEFLENLSAVAVVRDSIGKTDRFIGQTIDKYRVEREIGRGGMGAVYLATRADGAFQKRVAVKFIKRGTDSDETLRRFRQERNILAALEHPNIARLIDGGETADGTPFLVMEYVEGVPIDEFCKRNAVSIEEKLRLFQKICQAVAHAHRNLTIHRDLKSSNILVTESIEPKLLDFGIAKLFSNEEPGGETQTDLRAFTPEYASPEQLRGEKLTTATDVYSLGVILYELLAGARPFSTKGKNFAEVLRMISETNPTRPSAAVSAKFKLQTSKDEPETTNGELTANPKSEIRNPKSISSDLDNIVLKALAKEPERRYGSVEQFSDDIERYLKGLPVSARADTFVYRASKFVERNKLGTAAIIVILVLLIGGIAAVIWQAREAGRERALAEQRFNDVRELANSFMFEFHDAIENLPGATPARQLVVKRALDYLDKLARESANDAALQRELATAYEKIGRIQGNSYYSNLGDTEGAMQSYQRSLEIRQKLAAADAGNLELQNELSSSYEGVGDMLYTVNDLNGGLQNYEQAREIRENLSKSDEKNLAYLSALGAIYGKIGDIKGLDGYPNLGDTTGALEAYRKSTEIAEQISNAAPDNEDFQYEYAQRLENLGVMLGAIGKTADAIAEGEKADRIFSRLAARNPNNTNYELNKLSNLIFLRWVLSEDEQNEKAIEKSKQAITELEKMLAADPQNAFIERSLGVSRNALGRSLFSVKDFRGAIENHKRALEIAEKLLETDQSSAEKKQDAIHSLEYLADANFAARDFRAALENYRRAEKLLEETGAENSADARTIDDLSISRAGIGNSLAATGDYKNALENLRKAVSLAENAAQKSPFNARIKSRLALRYYETGKVYDQLRQTAQAHDFYRKSLEIWQELQAQNALRKIDIKPFNEAKKSFAEMQI